jgi:DNA-binding transcriptional ArsR family regulator
MSESENTKTNPTREAVFAALPQGDNWFTARDIAAEVGKGYSTVTAHLRALVEEGRAESYKTDKESKDGGAVIFRRTSPGAADPDKPVDAYTPAVAGAANGATTPPADVVDAEIVDETDEWAGAAADHRPVSPADGPDGAEGTDPPAGAADASTATVSGGNAELDAVFADLGGTADHVAAATAEPTPKRRGRKPRDPNAPVVTHTPRTDLTRKDGVTFRAPGALRDQVRAYVAEHPDREFGASELGRELTGDPHAIINILTKMVAEGTARLSQDKPRRWQSVPAEK